jgi:hypothetical protein
MLGIKSRLLAPINEHLPRTAVYSGGGYTVWCAGAMERAPSIAELFCGEGVVSGPTGRAWRSPVFERATENAAGGAVSILFSANGEPDFPDTDHRALVVPLRVSISKTLPDKTEALEAEIRNSTTREDLRRVRKAGFTFRTTRAVDDIRQFHSRHYAPLVARRFPEDGWVMSVKDLLNALDHGGELVCADLDGEWVAGLFNWVNVDHYAMGPLGIRGADEGVRQKRVVSGLLVASMERAVALRLPVATLGYSLPFLGKGPIWFKAKWGCTLAAQPGSPVMQMFMDLRHPHIRTALADRPIIHRDGSALAVSTWLMPGHAAWETMTHEVKRFPGLSKWYVLAEPKTLAAAQSALQGENRIVPVPVIPIGSEPLWLGSVLRRQNVRLSKQSTDPISAMRGLYLV